MFAGWLSHNGSLENLLESDVPSNVSCSFWARFSTLLIQDSEVVTLPWLSGRVLKVGVTTSQNWLFFTLEERYQRTFNFNFFLFFKPRAFQKAAFLLFALSGFINRIGDIVHRIPQGD